MLFPLKNLHRLLEPLPASTGHCSKLKGALKGDAQEIKSSDVEVMHVPFACNPLLDYIKRLFKSKPKG